MIEDAEEDAFTRMGDWSDPGPRRGAHVLLRDAEGRLLMQLRDADRPIAYPGYWVPFGGEVEQGETLRIAAIREIEEETGIRLTPGALTPQAAILSTWRAFDRARLYTFTAAMPCEPSGVRLGEGAGFGLLTRAQLDTVRIVPEFEAPIRALMEG